MSCTIRLATADDLPAINDIYNYYVQRSTCTYQLEPDMLAARQAWFAAHPPDKYPVTVGEIGSGKNASEVVAWGALSKFRERAAYAPSVEASIYVRHDMHRRGIGRVLLLDLIQRAKDLDFHTLIGGVSADQTASLALQEGLGFQRVAHFKEVGYKFGQRLDVIFLQLMLDERPA
ncbi:MAG TPA: GNAT family N-acetyltransferase [Pirellulaceae bacterium]|jgi:phosphinothricin acetyltransferase